MKRLVVLLVLLSGVAQAEDWKAEHSEWADYGEIVEAKVDLCYSAFKAEVVAARENQADPSPYIKSAYRSLFSCLVL